MFVMTSALSISMQAHAYDDCYNAFLPDFNTAYCVQQRNQRELERKQRELEAAKTEFMKQEAELMKEKARILRECGASYPPSWCKNLPQL